MSNYDRYSKFIVRSVDHIFKNFFRDEKVTEVYESQSTVKDPKVMVEINGTLSGELIINFPVKTLNHLTRQVMSSSSPRNLKKHHEEVAGEIANMITGTFANLLQYMKHNVSLAAPEFNEDPITIKTFYENINLSFDTSFGGFDIDLYYKEND